jgi:dUTP pyrophosphatase
MAWLDKMKSVEIEPGDTVRIPTGLKFKIPYGYELQIRPRSGLASRGIVAQFGTVDSDYRGFVDVILHNNSNQEIAVEHGDRIAQAVLAPVIRAVFVQGEVTDDTARGSGGFGSTGI